MTREHSPPIIKEPTRRPIRNRESHREMPNRGNAAELSRIQNLIKEMENDLSILKKKEPTVPETFMKRMMTLEMKYKTIEKTLRPPQRRIPGQFNNAKRIFSNERDTGRGFISDTMPTDLELSDEAPVKKSTLERQITAHKIK